MSFDLSQLVVVSADFRRAPIQFREQLAFGSGDIVPELALGSSPDISEAIWLETCDRVEAILLSCCEALGIEAVQKVWWEHSRVEVGEQWDKFIVYRGSGAFRHLTRTASGLDALFPLSRYTFEALSAAAKRATALGTARQQLNAIVAAVLEIAQNRVRDWPEPAAVAAACAMVNRHFGPLEGKHGLVIGTGELGNALARRMHSVGMEVTISSSSPAQARALARDLNAKSVLLEHARAALRYNDVVFGASVDTQVVRNALTGKSDPTTGSHPVLALDFSVPRVLTPLADIPGVFLYDVEYLSGAWRGLIDFRQVQETERAVAASVGVLLHAPELQDVQSPVAISARLA